MMQSGLVREVGEMSRDSNKPPVAFFSRASRQAGRCGNTPRCQKWNPYVEVYIYERQLPLQGAAVERFQQLRSTGQCRGCLGITDPLSFSLVHLRPFGLFTIDHDLEEVIRRLGRLGSQEGRRAHVWDQAQIFLNGADHTGLLPGLTTCRLLSCLLICFPPTLGQYPSSRACRLNHEDLCFVGREWNDASDQALAF